jgi:hypothetical protein
MSLPAAVQERASEMGRVAGALHFQGKPFERCPWRLTDPSITRSRQAAAWWQAFERSAHLPTV